MGHTGVDGRWRDGEMLGFDLETTGVDPFSDVPVSYALVRVDGGRVTDRAAAVVDPGRPIPAGATAVHGITDERARTEGMPLDAALERIADALLDAGSRGVPVVGMKLDYDLTIVETQCRSVLGAGITDRGWAGPVLDGLVLDRHVDRYRKGRRTLGDLCTHYEVPIERAHDAAADAAAAIGVVLALCDRYPELCRFRLPELHRLEAGWHREWAESYDSWRRSKGMTPLEDVGSGWPIAESRRGADQAVA